MTSGTRRAACATLAVVLGWSGTAPAESGSGAAAAVTAFSGKSGKSARDHVVRALDEAHVAQVRGAPVKDLGDAPKAYVAAAKKRHIDRFVTGSLEKGKKGALVLTVVVRSGEDGSVRSETVFEGKGLAGLLKDIDRNAADRLGPALHEVVLEEEPAAPPDEEERKPEKDFEKDARPGEPPDPEPRDEPEQDAHEPPASSGPRPSPLSLDLSARAVSRSFGYDSVASQSLRGYDLGGAPAGRVAAVWYPGAHVTDGALAHLGIAADFEQSVATASARDGAGGGSFDTSMRAYSVGLRGRIPLGPHELGVSAAYGRHEFQIGGDQDPAPQQFGTGRPSRDLLPDVGYSYVRPALDARLHVLAFSVGASLGYRHVVDLGDLGSARWFPKASAAAFDAGLFGAYEVARDLALVVGGDLQLYAVNLHAGAGELSPGARGPGGATDRYLSGFLGIEWRPAPGASARSPGATESAGSGKRRTSASLRAGASADR